MRRARKAALAECELADGRVLRLLSNPPMDLVVSVHLADGSHQIRVKRDVEHRVASLLEKLNETLPISQHVSADGLTDEFIQKLCAGLRAPLIEGVTHASVCSAHI